MQQRDPSPPPGDRARRRSLFTGRSEPGSPPVAPGRAPSAAERAEAVIAAYQEMIQEQLDEGLRSIQHTANSLMHEIAAEVWRSAGGDKEAVGSSILQELSRDQAIRALIAHSDERFQALAARTGRLEDTMNMLAEGVRTAREQIERSADALAESGGSPIGVGQLRAQLDDVARQVATAFQTLADRDQAIVDTVHERIREHGELVTHETARISQAMQEYVQQGVEAMGMLARSTDSQMQSIAEREDEIAQRVHISVEQHVSRLAEQLQLLYDRTGIAMTSLHESVTFLGDRVGVESRERLAEMNRAFESRVLGLANLVRSDSEALRRELVRTTEEHDATLARTIDERLGRLIDAVTGTLTETLRRGLDETIAQLAAQGEEQNRLIEAQGEEQNRLIEAKSDEQNRLIEAKSDEHTRLIDGRMNETVSSIDRNMIRMVDSLEESFERLGSGVGERAATAADLAISGRFDDVLARLHDAAGQIERGHAEARTALEESTSAFDKRFASLAKLIRSDNETLAQQIVADQEASKQALRAMKELQASLPSEVIQMVEERFSSLAESIERSNEMLAARIDRMADTIGQRQNDDIQIVIDRMGDAMHALASLGRPDDPPGNTPRIEID